MITHRRLRSIWREQFYTGIMGSGSDQGGWYEEGLKQPSIFTSIPFKAAFLPKLHPYLPASSAGLPNDIVAALVENPIFSLLFEVVFSPGWRRGQMQGKIFDQRIEHCWPYQNSVVQISPILATNRYAGIRKVSRHL